MNHKLKTLGAGILMILLFSLNNLNFGAYQTEAPKSPAIAIMGGILLDVETGKELNNYSIIVEDNRIKEVAPSDQISPPASAEVFDASGKWILPGLIDMHCHLGNNEVNEVQALMNMYLANGITTIRDVGGNVTQLRLLRRAVDSRKRMGPRLFFSGQILDGDPPLWPDLSFLVETPLQAESAVKFLASQGVDCIKVYNSIKEPVLKVIIETAQTYNLPVVGHIPRSMTMTRAVELGMKGLEHVRITGKELLPPDEANSIDFLPYAKRETLLWQRFDLDSKKMRRLISLLVDHKVFLDPTLSAAEATFVLTPSIQIKHPNNAYLPSQIFDNWMEWYKNIENDDIYSIPPEMKKAALEGYEKRKRFVALCAQAGVQILAGTDGPDLGTLLPGFGLHHELELLVEAGLETLQAIQAATLEAARALNREHDIGSVDAGKLADLVILNANPFENIANINKIYLVIKDGEIYDPMKIMVKR
jgi:imidazolonepropionase-like amidohydrolase